MSATSHDDPHDQRKHGPGGIEARMIQGETVPRVSQVIAPAPETVERIRKTFNHPDKVLNHSLAHKCANELEKALARIIQLEATMAVVAKHSNRDRDRIIELEKELAATRKDKERLDWFETHGGSLTGVNWAYAKQKWFDIDDDKTTIRKEIDAAMPSRQQGSE